MKRKDLTALLDICKKSFPCSFKWSFPHILGKQYWISLLGNKTCETWLLIDNEKVAGFILLVIDIKGFNKYKECSKISCFDLIQVFIRSPVAFLKVMLCKMFALRHKKIKYFYDISNSHNKIIWIELIAVIPNMRGMRIGLKLLEWSEKRAVGLDFNKIVLQVRNRNTNAIRLYERYGFERQ